MAQRLIKLTNATYTPGNPGSPGAPAIPFRPAYSAVEAVTVCDYTPTGYEWTITGYDDRGDPIYTYLPVYSSGGDQYACRTEFKTVFYPARASQPAIAPSAPSAAQTVYDFQLGWNSRAQSIKQMTRDGKFTFRVPRSAVGVVVGLTRSPKESGYSDLLWGFYVSGGVVRLYESGVEVQYIGAQPNALLSLRRRLGQIEYRIDDVLVRTSPNNADPMTLGAAMYSGGDSVEDAAYVDENFGSGVGIFPAAQGFAGTGAYAIGAGTFPAMTGQGLSYNHGSGAGEFPAAQGFASDAGGYAQGIGVFPAAVSQAEGLVAPPAYALGAGIFPQAVSAATGLTGTIGQGAGVFPAAAGMASEGAYAAGAGVFPAMQGVALEGRGSTEVLVLSQVLAVHSSSYSGLVMVVLDERMQAVGVVSVQSLLSASVAASLGVNHSVLTQQELSALVASLMSARGVTEDDATRYTVWAMNTEIAGSTRYENYGFNSFAKIGGVYYGANADGLFELSGADDAGVDINAEVNFGNLNFGTSSRKALPYVYVGMASNGSSVLKVVADDKTYFYNVRDSSDVLKMQRFELGRGLRATYYDLTLQNFGGSAFELAEIEFTPLPLSRRL